MYLILSNKIILNKLYLFNIYTYVTKDKFNTPPNLNVPMENRIPKDNIAKYNFQLNYAANHVDKNPGKYCYINDTKFGEVSVAQMKPNKQILPEVL